MTLTERFIEISRSPTSSKTWLWTGFLLFNHALTLLITITLDHYTDIGQLVDLRSFNQFSGLWLASLLLVFALCRVCMWRDLEGRWTAYLLVFVYSSFTVMLIHLMGSANTFYWSLLLTMVFLMFVFWDPWVGMFSIVCSLVGMSVVIAAELMDSLAYAPLVIERQIDGLNSPPVSLFILGLNANMMVFCSATMALVLSAGRLQRERLTRAQAVIRRYLPSQVADAILADDLVGEGGQKRRKLTLFFSDLVGFTEISEELEPEDLSQVLNVYFSAMTAIADEHGGTIDELSGDAILVFFGAPSATTDADHAQRAVHMAVAMQARMAALNEGWAKAGIPVILSVRMGVNTGVVTVGNFGSAHRRKYAALGKHVNLAGRIQSFCEPGKVLISYATWLLVREQIQCLPMGEQIFKGITKPVALYEVDVASIDGLQTNSRPRAN